MKYQIYLDVHEPFDLIELFKFNLSSIQCIFSVQKVFSMTIQSIIIDVTLQEVCQL